MAIEMGRPGTGTRFHDVEKVTVAVAHFGVHFDPRNPVTCLMEDTTAGTIRKDVLNEKVLSAIIGFDIPLEQIVPVMEKLKEVMSEIATVCSLDLACRLGPEGDDPAVRLLRETGVSPSLHGKTNVGLGRPLARED